MPQSRFQHSRMCIACRSVRPVSELMRFVREPDGLVVADPSGHAPGRGAYICQKSNCFEQAIRRKAFRGAFKKPILSISTSNGESTST